MKGNPLFASLLCAAGFVFPCAYARPGNALRNPLPDVTAEVEAQPALGLAQPVKISRQAVLDLRAPAEKGDAFSQYALGLSYANGQAVEKDCAEAVRWFRRAAKQNHALAQYNLGFCYSEGQGVEKDYAEAAKWFRKAAEQNVTEAECFLGFCYYDGKGVEKDYAQAVRWFRKAAEQDSRMGQYSLGVCYANGQGVEKDCAEAHAWYNLAAKTSERVAKDRDALETTMSPQQVADAQKRTKELQALIEAKLKSSGK